jgi:hypothetical protein
MIDNRYFTLIKGDREEILSAVHEALISYGKKLLSYNAPLNLDLTDVHHNPVVLKCQLWTPDNSEGVACFSNLEDGMPFLVYRLMKIRPFEITRVSLEFDIDCEFNYAMRVFHHIDIDGNERYVRVMQDPKWDFWEQGERLPFEQVDKYSERFIKKRLTNEMILDYALALGWDLRSPDFWKSSTDARYYEWSNR